MRIALCVLRLELDQMSLQLVTKWRRMSLQHGGRTNRNFWRQPPRWPIAIFLVEALSL